MIRQLRGFAVVALALAIVIFVAAEMREQMNADDTLPSITMDSDAIDISYEYTTDQLLEGVTAYDEAAGVLYCQV